MRPSRPSFLCFFLRTGKRSGTKPLRMENKGILQVDKADVLLPGSLRPLALQLVEHQGGLSVRSLHHFAAGGQREEGLVVRRTFALADPAAGGDVVGAAGHGFPGKVVEALREFPAAPGLADDGNHLAVIALRMLHAVHVEQAELLIRDPDDIRLHIIGQVLVRDAVIHRAVQVFKHDCGGTVHGA